MNFFRVLDLCNDTNHPRPYYFAMQLALQTFVLLYFIFNGALSHANTCVEFLSPEYKILAEFFAPHSNSLVVVNVYQGIENQWAVETFEAYIKQSKSKKDAAEIIKYFKLNKNLSFDVVAGEIHGIFVEVDGYKTSFATYLEMYSKGWVDGNHARVTDSLKINKTQPSSTEHFGRGANFAVSARRPNLDDYDQYREPRTQYRSRYGLYYQDDERSN